MDADGQEGAHVESWLAALSPVARRGIDSEALRKFLALVPSDRQQEMLTWLRIFVDEMFSEPNAEDKELGISFAAQVASTPVGVALMRVFRIDPD